MGDYARLFSRLTDPSSRVDLDVNVIIVVCSDNGTQKGHRGGNDDCDEHFITGRLNPVAVHEMVCVEPHLYSDTHRSHE